MLRSRAKALPGATSIDSAAAAATDGADDLTRDSSPAYLLSSLCTDATDDSGGGRGGRGSGGGDQSDQKQPKLGCVVVITAVCTVVQVGQKARERERENQQIRDCGNFVAPFTDDVLWLRLLLHSKRTTKLHHQ